MFSQSFTITHLYRFKNILYFMKHDPEVNSFTRIGTYMFHKKFLTTRVLVNFLDGTRYSTSIYRLHTQLWRYNTRKYSLGDLILLAKSKEYTLLSIPDKFQGVWMTKHFRKSVFYRSLNMPTHTKHPSLRFFRAYKEGFIDCQLKSISWLIRRILINLFIPYHNYKTKSKMIRSIFYFD